MLSSPENSERQIDRMSGCASMVRLVWKWTLRLLLTGAILYLAVIVFYAVFWMKWEWGAHQKIHIKSTLKDLQVALGHFKTEYGELPIKPDESQMLRTEGTLLLSLMGEEIATNPRGIRFVDLPIARIGRSGLINLAPNARSITPETALVDAWGERYYLLLESTGDDRIPNPERLPGATGKVLRRATDSIPASSLIFSSGPDKDPSTWDDNVCSWR